MALPPTRVPETNLGDDQDPSQELGQRTAGIAQQTQGMVQTIAFTTGGRQAAGRRANEAEQGQTRDAGRGEVADRREEAQGSRRDIRQDPEPVEAVEAVAVTGLQPAAEAPATSRPRLALVPDPQDIADKVDQLQADRDDADDAANAAAQWSQNDDDPSTIAWIAGTNKGGKRGAKSADARGDSNEQVGEEAHRGAVEDYLTHDTIAEDYLTHDSMADEPLAGGPSVTPVGPHLGPNGPGLTR